MKLAFKGKFGFIKEKDVPMIVNMGVIINVCKNLKIELWELDSYIQNDNFGFITELLYQGWIEAYKNELFERRHFFRKKYTFHNAVIWAEYLSESSRTELTNMLKEFQGAIEGGNDKKKVI